LRYFRKKILEWGADNYKPFPWRTTSNLFHGLVAEIMLQRTRAEQVEPLYREFAARFPTPRDALTHPDEVTKLLRPLGLAWRTRLLLRMFEELDRMGHIPCDAGALQGLPGVGPYAAAAFICFHCEKRAVPIDSNIVRLYGRFFGLKTGPETRRQKSFIMFADMITPRKGLRQFSYAVIDHSRAICRPKPLCDRCTLRRRCCHFRARTAHPDLN